MIPPQLPEVSKRIAAGLDDMTTGLGFLPSHLRWELLQVMSRLRPDDLSVVEIAALLVILEPAHSRIVGRPTGRRTPPATLCATKSWS